MIIPPYLLQHLADLTDPDLARVAAAAQASLEADHPFRGARLLQGSRPPAAHPTVVPGAAAPGPNRTICNAHGSEVLPGTVVRSEGDAAGTDLAVTEAYDGLGYTHAFFRTVLDRASIDNANMPLLATVHFGDEYDNAFWDGKRMVFGDGDGIIFNRMTASLSVIGHELAHGVTEYTANLTYEGQSGALNESVSDVFGALVEQYTAGHSAETAHWLIGLGLFTDGVEGEALRSLKAPGTAYNDDILGQDPQPAHMRDYIDTTDDYGGVHLNSGIPNHAFYLLATALGGNAWERAGLIWYEALTGPLTADTDFRGFADATVTVASARYGFDSPESAAVGEAWAAVGIDVSPLPVP